MQGFRGVSVLYLLERKSDEVEKVQLIRRRLCSGRDQEGIKGSPQLWLQACDSDVKQRACKKRVEWS